MPKKRFPPLRLKNAKHAFLHQSCIALPDILGQRLKISDLQGSLDSCTVSSGLCYIYLGHDHTKTTGSARPFLMGNFSSSLSQAHSSQ
jgi:hypothetical protein